MQPNIASDMNAQAHGQGHHHPEHAAPQAPHEHAHDHAHEHGHAHAHSPAASQTAPQRRARAERSLLARSAWQRLAGAVVLVAGLWAVVAWALTGNPA